MLYEPFVHLPYAPYLPPKILHNLRFSFLLGITAAPKEIKTSAYAKCWNTFKVHYGRCARGVCLAGFLKTLSPDGSSGETAFLRQKISPK